MIVLDEETGQLYSLYYSEKDNYKVLHAELITLAYATHLCTESHDFIKKGSLEQAIKEHEQ